MPAFNVTLYRGSFNDADNRLRRKKTRGSFFALQNFISTTLNLSRVSVSQRVVRFRNKNPNIDSALCGLWCEDRTLRWLPVM